GVTKALGNLHQATRLPVALGSGHSEVAGHVLLRISALLVPNQHHRFAIESGEAPDDRRVLSEIAVARELEEIREQKLHVVEEVRPGTGARQLNDLPTGKVVEDLASQPGGLLLQPADLHREIGRTRR